MRQGPNNRRPRSRNSGGNRRPNVPNRNQTFDSNGPDVRIRGNAYQVYEKYLALARDATASGDRVMAENYLQHAEHYHRIILSMNDPQNHTSPFQAQPAEMRETPQREGGDEEEDEQPQHREPRRPVREPRAQRHGRDNDGRAYGRPDGMAEGTPALRAEAEDDRQPGLDPREDVPSFIEFGQDPREGDGEDGNGRADGHMASAEAADPLAAPDEARGDVEAASRAPRRRRGLGRQRRSATGQGAGDLGEGKPDDEPADLGL